MTISIETLAKYIEPGGLFLETGTHEGHGVQRALDCGAGEVHSCEADPGRHAIASRRFAGDARVHLYLGSSAAWLPRILAGVDRPATFWLDAHQGKRCGLLAELAAIAEHARRDHTILIDDIRLFYKWGLDLAGVKALLLDLNPEYRLLLEPGIVPEDILAAVP
jgi:hypothetical protein